MKEYIIYFYPLQNLTKRVTVKYYTHLKFVHFPNNK